MVPNRRRGYACQDVTVKIINSLFGTVKRAGQIVASAKKWREPGTANAPSAATLRDRALALQPGLESTLERQHILASMPERDRVLSLNSALRDQFAKNQGMGKTSVEETTKGVWKLVELAETTGVKIIPTNGE